MKLTNNARRRLGIPGRSAIILTPNQSIEITKARLDEMKQNRTVANWFQSGILTVDDVHKVEVETKPKPEVETKPKPEAPAEDQGVEVRHVGGGWFEVWVNGFQVTDTNVRKAKAREIAAEYG